MRFAVDLTKCQGYGQCAFLAPDVFRMSGDGALIYDPSPDDVQRRAVLRRRILPRSGHPVCDRTEEPNGPRAPGETPTDADGSPMGSSGPGGSSSSAPRWRACGPRNGCGRRGFAGHMPPEGTALPRRREFDAEWRLGVAATGLDVAGKRVHLAGGTRIGFDKVLIATGVRARP